MLHLFEKSHFFAAEPWTSTIMNRKEHLGVYLWVMQIMTDLFMSIIQGIP